MQGLPQWIKAQLESSLSASKYRLKIQFQGGFCGKECSLTLKLANEVKYTSEFFPGDTNDYQEFELESGEIEVDNVQVTFKSTTDFYGRIIVYQLSLEKL